MCFFRLMGRGDLDRLWQESAYTYYLCLFLLAALSWFVRWIARKGFNKDVLSGTTARLFKIAVFFDIFGLALFDCPWSWIMAFLFRKEVAKCLNWIGLGRNNRFLNRSLQIEYSSNQRRVRTIALFFYAPTVLIGMLVWRFVNSSQIMYPIKEVKEKKKAKVISFERSSGFAKREEREYYDSVYYQMTHKPYWNVEDDKGAYGEYLIWRELRWIGASSDNCKLVKFLFNAYIPKGDGKTAELDVIMLCPQGIFAFESKNYSGWIFGGEFDKNWTQTLPVANGEVEKHHFYNPVMQNKTHIDTLKRFLKRNIPIWNVVVFSERCDLKSVEVQSSDVFAIQRGKLYSLVDMWIGNRTAVLSESEIEELYQSLYPFTQVSEDVKTKHNEDANRHR